MYRIWDVECFVYPSRLLLQCVEYSTLSPLCSLALESLHRLAVKDVSPEVAVEAVVVSVGDGQCWKMPGDGSLQ